jgi:hypothetical protein
MLQEFWKVMPDSNGTMVLIKTHHNSYSGVRIRPLKTLTSTSYTLLANSR